MPKRKVTTPTRTVQSRPAKSKAREDRIQMEIVVDAYGPEEQAMGWYYYLEEKLTFPFRAKCIAERRISPLREGDKVVLRWSARATHQGDFVGVAGTGKPITMSGTETWLIREGKLQEEWAHWDALGLLRQVGVVTE